MDKPKKLSWPTGYDNALKPYGRIPFAVIDDEGNIWHRAKTKGWFTRMLYDNRATGGGYHSRDCHLKSHPLNYGKYIWSKKELEVINKP